MTIKCFYAGPWTESNCLCYNCYDKSNLGNGQKSPRLRFMIALRPQNGRECLALGCFDNLSFSQLAILSTWHFTYWFINLLYWHCLFGLWFFRQRHRVYFLSNLSGKRKQVSFKTKKIAFKHCLLPRKIWNIMNSCRLSFKK